MQKGIHDVGRPRTIRCLSASRACTYWRPGFDEFGPPTKTRSRLWLEMQNSALRNGSTHPVRENMIPLQLGELSQFEPAGLAHFELLPTKQNYRTFVRPLAIDLGNMIQIHNCRSM
jgi:hypothetical protein